jgi:hypothetical protein
MIDVLLILFCMCYGARLIKGHPATCFYHTSEALQEPFKKDNNFVILRVYARRT